METSYCMLRTWEVKLCLPSWKVSGTQVPDIASDCPLRIIQPEAVFFGESGISMNFIFP